MKFDQKDYDEIERFHTTSDKTGYMILLGGKPFKNYTNKCVFNTKLSAMCSLNYSMSWRISNIVERKLKALGLTEEEIRKDAERINAWKNFVKQAKADGFLQIVELK